MAPKTALFFVAAALAYLALTVRLRLDALSGALVALVLGVFFALAASAAASPLAVALGSLGALVAHLVADVSFVVGGATFVAFAFAERTTRVRGRASRAAHVALALLGGALFAALAQSYAGARPLLLVTSLSVACVLVALPLLLDADDPLAHTLDAVAATVADPARSALHHGAELRRSVSDVALDRGSRREARTTWGALERLAVARERLERRGSESTSSSPRDAVRAMLDGRIRDHVVALERLFAAADTARAARLGIDDAALRNVTVVNEALEDQSRAMLDVSEVTTEERTIQVGH